MSNNGTPALKRSRLAWYFYDFGNSAYASIILLAVFSAYFKNVVVGGAEGTRLWGISVGIAAVLVAVVSPLLGAIADLTKYKRKFLILFTVVSVVFTALLFFVREGDVFLGMLFFILAEIGYRAAQVFYDALLSDISTAETVGSISGKGWAMGMAGGILSLLLVLLPLQLIGNSVIPYAFLITAAFYLLSAIPSFLWVEEIQEAKQIPAGESALSLAVKKLAETFRSIKSYKEFVKYMIAYLLYNDGIMMLMDFAAIIGATLYGLSQIQLILVVIILQLAGAFGALFFGRIADKKSGKEATLLALVILTVTVSTLFFWPSLAGFYVIAFFAGFSLSGAQAVSRSMVVQIAPPHHTAEFYGFLSVAGRTSTFIGPLVFGTLTFRTNAWYVKQGMDIHLAEQYSLLWGIGSIVAFLVVGSILLLFVKRVRASAHTEPAEQPAE